MCRIQLSALAIVLFSLGVISPMSAADASPQKVASADAVLSISIAVKDHTPTGERSHARNRCFATVTVRNNSTKKATFPLGYADFNWSMESAQLATDSAAGPEPVTTYRSVTLSAFGAAMATASRSRSLDAGIDAGQQQTFDVDLGRLFDLSLSRRYFLSGKLGYAVDGQPAELGISRVEVIPDDVKP